MSAAVSPQLSRQGCKAELLISGHPTRRDESKLGCTDGAFRGKTLLFASVMTCRPA